MRLFDKKTTVRCHLGSASYDILIGSNVLRTTGDVLKRHTTNPLVMVVTNDTVAALYVRPLLAALKRAGFTAFIHTVPDGEHAKSEKELFRLLTALLENHFERDSTVIALGGGVVGDLAGFAASVYMRGIRFVNVPTTVLSQVDSAIGGKTGINLSKGKNLVGSFYQPAFVISDIETLETLPRKEIINGAAEVIKYGVISDAVFFEYLEKNIKGFLDLDAAVVLKVITKCVQAKVRIVEKDEREAGVRAVLNFGHTFAHALETCGKYKKVTHGMAVALGMIAAGRLACRLELFDAAQNERLQHLILRAGLPMSVRAFKFDSDGLLDVMASDKKVKNRMIHVVLPTDIGTVIIRDDIKRYHLKEAFDF